MKNIILLFLFFLLGNIYCFSQYDVRKVNWGMSKQQVEKSEKYLKKLKNEDEESLTYKTTLLNKEVYLDYSFKENKLRSVFYYFERNHTNHNDYIDDYIDLKEALIKKYGEPSSDDIIWENNLHKDNLQEYGLAISVGLLEYLTQWTHINNTTNIVLNLYGKDNKINLNILYASLKALIEDKQDPDGL